MNKVNWASTLVIGLIAFIANCSQTFAQHSAKVEPTQIDAARDELPFRVYAQWVIDTFDKDGDGSLTKEELQDMQGQLGEERFDLDQNGKLSFEEIVQAIRRPSAAVVQANQDVPKITNQITTASRFERYAQALMEHYDTDKDGLLNTEENQKMRRPVSESADKNGDQKISVDEIRNWLAGLQGQNQTAAQGQAPRRLKVAVDPDLTLEADQMAERFFEASLRKNDKNGDRILDADEIQKASWSTPRWQVSDTNRDGELSENELRVRYRKMFERLMTAQTSPQNDALTSGSIAAIMSAASGGTVPEPKLAIAKSTRAIDTQLYLMRLPSNFQAGRMESLVSELRESDQPIAAAVEKLAKQVGVSAYDQVHVSGLDQMPIKVVVGAAEPYSTGMVQASRGRAYQQQQVDVGLSVGIEPVFSGNDWQLSLQVEKSEVLPGTAGEDDPPNRKILNLKLETTIKLKPGNPAVISSSSSGHHWILAVAVNDPG